jgi:hypothetical protein
MISSSKDAPTGAAMTTCTVDEFVFEDAGRTFLCSPGAQRGPGAEGWWWFRLAADTRGQRYAPFRTSAGDTRAGVQARIVEYYDNLLVQRALPATRSPWGSRPNVATAAPAPLAVPDDVPVA